MDRLVAGATLWGMFEGRVQRVLDEIRQSKGSVILFIDELHTIMWNRGRQDNDVANILKPALARGDFMVRSIM